MYKKCFKDIFHVTESNECSHSLSIETGRYNTVDKSVRFCKCCNMNVIEDEYHFLLVCPYYSNLRHGYFSRYFCHWPNLYKFYLLLSCNYSTVKVNKLGKFLYFAFKHRDSLL